MEPADFLAIAYEIVALLAARVFYGAIRREDGALMDGSVDNALMGLMGLIGGQFWPLALPIALVIWRPKKTPQEVAEENLRMKARIAELERELGIG